MTREELLEELERIIDVGIVNAKHDTDVLKHCYKLLKEDEPVPAQIEGAYTTWWYVCGECNTAIDRGDKYCRQCGRMVNWN